MSLLTSGRKETEKTNIKHQQQKHTLFTCMFTHNYTFHRKMTLALNLVMFVCFTVQKCLQQKRCLLIPYVNSSDKQTLMPQCYRVIWYILAGIYTHKSIKKTLMKLLQNLLCVTFCQKSPRVHIIVNALIQFEIFSGRNKSL